MKLKKMVLGLGLLAALGLALAYAYRAPLSLAIASRVAAAHLAADPLRELPDGLHVGLCGAGSPFSDDKRGGPCTLVIAGQRAFVFDAGNAAVRNLGRFGLAHGRIEAIFLTHFHSDHLDGLGELLLQRWVSTGNAKPAPVYGPEGVQAVVDGLREAYRADSGYRIAHHGEATLPPGGFGGEARAFTAPAGGPLVLLKEGELEIAAFAVDHAPVQPAVGYHIRYKGRSVVISGDTKKSSAVLREAKGVDLLVHEALAAPMVGLIGEAAAKAGRHNVKKLMADIVDYHTSPEEAAEVARDAQVRFLLLNHIAPPLPLPGMEAAFLGRAGEIYTGPLRVGIDGDLLSLPAGSQDIRHQRRF